MLQVYGQKFSHGGTRTALTYVHKVWQNKRTCIYKCNMRRRGGIEPLHVSMPRELKSRPSTSPTHPGLRIMFPIHEFLDAFLRRHVCTPLRKCFATRLKHNRGHARRIIPRRGQLMFELWSGVREMAHKTIWPSGRRRWFRELS